MARLFTTALAATLLFASAAVAQHPTPSNQSKAMLKAVVHVNYGDSERQENMLGNLENILAAEPTAQLEVVCHGPGISLLQNEQTKHAEAVQKLMKRGIRFAACENTMKKKGIERSELLEGTTTVPSGAVEVLRKQQQGYGYLRP